MDHKLINKHKHNLETIICTQLTQARSSRAIMLNAPHHSHKVSRTVKILTSINPMHKYIPSLGTTLWILESEFVVPNFIWFPSRLTHPRKNYAFKLHKQPSSKTISSLVHFEHVCSILSDIFSKQRLLLGFASNDQTKIYFSKFTTL